MTAGGGAGAGPRASPGGAAGRQAGGRAADDWAVWDRPPRPAGRPPDVPRASASRGRTGRRPGGDDTRGRILAAARAEFGERGFDGATIRSVAAAAGVDPALIHHYYGSKQRLFVAAMELPVDFEAAVETILSGPPDEVGERFVRWVLRLWDAPPTRGLMLGLVRSAASDAVAASMLRRLLAEGPFLALARAIELPDAELRSVLVGTQVVGLAMARYVVGVEPIASEDVEDLARQVGPTIQRYLTGDLARAVGRPGGA